MDFENVDLSALASDASQYSVLPGVPSDAITQQFLGHYPLPVLLGALETGGELESSIVLVLEKVYSTHFGAQAMFQALPYAKNGLEAFGDSIRRLTCVGISKFLEYASGKEEAAHALVANNLIVPLVNAVADRDPGVAAAAAGAVVNLAKTSIGVELLFGVQGGAKGLLNELAVNGPSLVRIRIFSLIAHLFGQCGEAATAIRESGIFAALEAELGNKSDTLVQMNALELLEEITATTDGARFFIEGGFIKYLILIMGSSGVDPLVRAQSMMVGSRLISPGANRCSPISKEDGLLIVQIMDTVLSNAEDKEKAAALDALGRVGISKQGAELLFLRANPIIPPTAHHVVHAAFSRRGGDSQMIGIHALASIVGSERPSDPLLSDHAEASLKELVYTELERGSKWTPTDVVLWLLQQAYEIRLAAYRLIVPMVSRPWFLAAICSNMKIIDFLTNPHSEQVKEGMEWRHATCTAISAALAGSNYRTDPKLQEVLEKVQAAVRQGPYFGRAKPEAQPLVVTQERF